MAAHINFFLTKCTSGLNIYELFHSKSCLNSGFFLEWEAQSEYFLVLYSGLFSRLLHIGVFPIL